MSQKQVSGDDSFNIQAEGTVSITTGISVSDARQIAVDVLRANFIEIQGIARRIVDERFQTFTDEFLKRIAAERPECLSSIQDPDIQYSFYVAGTQYARSGDDELRTVLTNLLIERCTETGRTLQTLALNEAISVAGRLTKSHVITLVMNWYLREVKHLDVKNVEMLIETLRNNILPFVPHVCTSEVDYRYLIYMGCASQDAGYVSFGSLIAGKYPGLFSAGYSPHAIPDKYNPYRDVIYRKCDYNPELFQINAIYLEDARAIARTIDRPEWADALEGLLKQNVLDKDGVADIIATKEPGFRKIINLFEDHSMGYMRLTPVGVAIAHSYWNRLRKIGDQVPLSIWIPDEKE